MLHHATCLCHECDCDLGVNMSKRKLRLDGYGISGKRCKELCGFCEQYPDWKKEITNHAYISAVKYGDEPKPSNHENADTTAKQALKLMEYRRNISLIEKVAKMADDEFWEYLIKAVCYEVPVPYLISEEGMNLSQSAFYNRRRYFFYLLDIEKRKTELQNVEK